jgi:hypothetical protein
MGNGKGAKERVLNKAVKERASEAVDKQWISVA